MKKYRKCAGTVLFNNAGKVLVFARIDEKEDAFQFSQGGIEEDETPLKAALRELKEETSITSVKPVFSYPSPLCYDFPEAVKEKLKTFKNSFDGQEVHFFLLYFTGSDLEINLQTAHPEFKSFKWIDINKAPLLIVDFKREVYERVCAEFAPQIEKYLKK